MSSDDSQNPETDLREKISRRMRAIGPSSSPQIPAEQLQKLQTAATRLDQLLKLNAAENEQVLKSAAQKLGQLLSKIRKGKDVTGDIKLRREGQSSSE